MRTKNAPFTFLGDFQVIPMDSGSYMIEQGLKFSRAFSNLEQVVDFLIQQKELFLASIATTSEGTPDDYETFDETSLPRGVCLSCGKTRRLDPAGRCMNCAEEPDE